MIYLRGGEITIKLPTETRGEPETINAGAGLVPFAGSRSRGPELRVTFLPPVFDRTPSRPPEAGHAALNPFTLIPLAFRRDQHTIKVRRDLAGLPASRQLAHIAALLRNIR